VAAGQKPSGVLFDFDGVIVDSLSMHITAWDLATDEMFGIKIRATMEADLVGRSTYTIAALISDHVGAPSRANELANLKKQKLREMTVPPPLLPGVREVFKFLGTSQIPFGIASNAPRLFIDDTLRAHNIKIQEYVGIEDSPRPKPAPDIYLECARRLRIPFTEHPKTLVFEDSTHGLKAGIDAGMIAIGVTSAHPATQLLDAGAVKVCESLDDAFKRGFFG